MIMGDGRTCGGRPLTAQHDDDDRPARRRGIWRARSAAVFVLGLALSLGPVTSSIATAGPAVDGPPAESGVSARAVPRAVPVGSRTVFIGDYETGDFSQWETCQSALSNTGCKTVGKGDRTMRIVPGAHQGQWAARFEVRPGDVPNFGGGERSEVSSGTPSATVRAGDERWYQWSMLFPSDFATPKGVWFIVMQWHSGSGSPPLAINISNQGTVDIGGDGLKSEPKRTIGPVRRGQWVDYTLHVKFSRNSSDGFVEAWENGQQTVQMTHRATMTSASNYLKQGIYRDHGPVTSVVMDGLRVTAP